MLGYYKIAGLTVEMDTTGRTLEQARPYKIQGVALPDITVESYAEEVKGVYPKIDADMAEYLGTGVGFYKELLRFAGLMLHASAVVVDGKAYLFSAAPGVGKSTHTMLWLQEFGPRAYILNDDKPALRRIDETWYAFGTPWSGKHDISENIGVPIAGIAMLERGTDNQISRCAGKDVLAEILCQVNRPKGTQYRRLLVVLLDLLLREVPIWRLKCNMLPEAAMVAYEAMSEKTGKEN